MQYRRPRFDPWAGKILWQREWQPTPVFLPGEFHGQRSLVGYSPWRCKSQTRLSDKHHSTSSTQQSRIPSTRRMGALVLEVDLSNALQSPPYCLVHKLQLYDIVMDKLMNEGMFGTYLSSEEEYLFSPPRVLSYSLCSYF